MTDLEERFSGALHNTSRAWRQALDRRLKYLGVSQASWMTIAVAAKAREPLSQSELAQSLGVEGATMVAMVDRLVKAGLVTREPSTTDRRVKRVVLTARRQSAVRQGAHGGRRISQGTAGQHRSEKTAGGDRTSRSLAGHHRHGAMTRPLNRPMITLSIMLATIMQTLDGTIANVALPHMQGTLSASQDQIAWVLTAYIVAAAIATPLTGWMVDRFGQKNVFLASIAGFTAASMLCGMAELAGADRRRAAAAGRVRRGLGAFVPGRADGYQSQGKAGPRHGHLGHGGHGGTDTGSHAGAAG